MSEKLQNILNWMQQYKFHNHVKGVVLGLSGGKDSTVVAMLAKKVFGDNVVAVMMPDHKQNDINDSIEIAQTLEVKSMEVNIGRVIDKLFNDIIVAGKRRLNEDFSITVKSQTNIPPRIRMTTLYAIAQSLGYLVIGTGNYSERYCSWFTKFGDGGYDFNPIQNFTKTEVVEIGLELAEEFGLDKKFITKAPSDGLTGKTDEANFGFTYDFLDKYLCGELSESEKEQNYETICKIETMHSYGSHKLSMPEGCPR